MASGAEARLARVRRALAACRACPKVVGPPVPGAPVVSQVLILGQAPGPHEAGRGRPFAATAGQTLFRWLEEATGADEVVVRQAVAFSAVARCFPGKAKGGGDRPPSKDEVARCSSWLAKEVAILEPRLVVPVGSHAITALFGAPQPLAHVVGERFELEWLGAPRTVIPLPHPSGASTWPRSELGRPRLAKALRLLAQNHEWKAAVARVCSAPLS